jgi:hypothetical protein
MAVFAAEQNLGISDGNLLCGDMTGQHSNKIGLHILLKPGCYLPYYELAE